jgi:hypothetical protein
MDWLSSLGGLIGFGDPGAAPPTQNPFDFGTPGQTQAAIPSWLDPVSEMFKRDLEASNPNTAPAATEAGQTMGEKAQELYFDDWGTGSNLDAGDQLQNMDPFSWRRVLDSASKMGKGLESAAKAAPGLLGAGGGQTGQVSPQIIGAPSLRTLEAIPAQFMLPLMQMMAAAGSRKR